MTHIIVKDYTFALPSPNNNIDSFDPTLIDSLYQGIHNNKYYQNKCIHKLNILNYSNKITDKTKEILDFNNLNMLECGIKLAENNNLINNNQNNEYNQDQVDIGIIVASAHLMTENILNCDNISKKRILKHLMYSGNQLANIINSNGTNFFLGSSCASLSTAISVVDDLLRSDKINQMIILSGDTPTSDYLSEIFVNGFSDLGAHNKTTLSNIPFKSFNGMTLSSGCGGIYMIKGIPQPNDIILLRSQTFNIAKHTLSLDIEKNIIYFKKFMDKINSIENKQIHESEIIYFAHDTGTSQCSTCEINMLSSYFKNMDMLTIVSVKPYLGHSLGHNIEHYIIYDLFHKIKNNENKSKNIKILYDGLCNNLSEHQSYERLHKIKYMINGSFCMTGNVVFTIYKIY